MNAALLKVCVSAVLSMSVLNNAVFISDTHSGCGLALCPPEGVTLDDGGEYHPSLLQQKMWGVWEAFWQWVEIATRGEPYHLVHNGDAIDGSHHQSTYQITHNLTTQRRIAFNILKEPVARTVAVGGTYWHIRGTEAHVGKSGQEEEALAKELGAKPSDNGNYARWELRLRVGKALVHATHHIGTTGSAAYEATGVHKELTEAYVEAARWGHEPPDVIVRSHRHRNVQTEIHTKKGNAFAFVTAAWQLKTPFAYRIPGGRHSQPQLGGSVVRYHDGEIFTRHFVYSLEPPAIEGEADNST